MSENDLQKLGHDIDKAIEHFESAEGDLAQNLSELNHELEDALADYESGSFITLTDDDGNEVEFEHIDTVEDGNEIYMAFIPASLPEDEPAEVVILKVANENGEELLVAVEDEAEAERIFQLVLERAESDEDDA